MSKIETEVLHKEIDLIQACITRMAHNSFLIKGWAVSIVAVVLALAEKAINPALLSAILLIPLISFWYLDAFFLYTEKLYRKLYEWVISERLKDNADKMYDLNPHRFKKQLKVRKWNKASDEMFETDKLENVWTVMWSKTLRCFYGIPLLIVTVIVLFQAVSGIITCCKNHIEKAAPAKTATAPEQPDIPKLIDAGKTNPAALLR
jgi:hypothetical protein